MPSESPLDPLAQFAKDLAALQREPAKSMWDPTSIDSMVDYAERELGVSLRAVPKVLEVFVEAITAFQQRKQLRLAVLGPRGGGKTQLSAAIELIAYRWFGYSWQNVGGSLEQAKLCYAYVKGAHASSQDLARFTVSCEAHDTQSRKGDTISISAASQTSVRGPHPVGSSGGGGLTLDEAAVIPDDICDASKGQLMSARPSALIQLSTMGERQVGRFWELLEDPAKVGYTLKKFDAFDVAKKCTYDCKTTCPIKEHFAEDFYTGAGDTRQLVHKAYCGGRAHDVNGWIAIDEVAQQFRELGRESFERELLGKSAGAVGHVYDPVLLANAIMPPRALSKDPVQHQRRFRAMDKAVAIDWGWSGQCAVCYVLRVRDILVVYDWDLFDHERFQVIREHVLRRCFEERIETALADAANPSDNEELAEMFSRESIRRGLSWNPRVLPVAFGKWKSYAVGEVRRRLEQGSLRFPTVFGWVTVREHERAMAYLRQYHTNRFGEIVKENDHVPDSLAMACVGFATSFRAQTTFIGRR